MTASLPGMLLALLAGAGVAWVNYLLTKKAVSRSDGAVGGVPVVRMFLNVGLLIALWFLAPLTPWDRMCMLAAAVVGLTVPMFIFTGLLVRWMNASEDKTKAEKGEDDNG